MMAVAASLLVFAASCGSDSATADAALKVFADGGRECDVDRNENGSSRGTEDRARFIEQMSSSRALDDLGGDEGVQSRIVAALKSTPEGSELTLFGCPDSSAVLYVSNLGADNEKAFLAVVSPGVAFKDELSDLGLVVVQR